MRNHREPLLLCAISLLSILEATVSWSPLSFSVHFSRGGYDPQEVLFHETPIPKNSSSVVHGGCVKYTGHRDKVVLGRKKRKNFEPRTCDCSRFDGLMYARPALLRNEVNGDEVVASFKMTLCLRMDRRADHAGAAGRRTGLFMFLVPYPWYRNDDGVEGIEVGLDNACTTAVDDDDDKSNSLGGGGLPVLCAHVHYDSAEELLKTNVRIGDRSCLCVRKIPRGRMPREAAVGFASTMAGDPIKLHNILTWAFHSTLDVEESKGPPPTLSLRSKPEPDVATDARLRFDPWNRNAELNLRYQQSWQQLRCSISVTLGYGNGNEDTD